MTCCGVVTFWIFLLFSLILLNVNLTNGGRPDELHIGGIFPIAGKGGWQGGQACMPAAKLALDDVNKEKNLLPGFKLILHSNDSEYTSPRMDLTTCLLYLLAAIAAYLVFQIHEHMNYWKKRGVCYDQPHPIFGNVKGVSVTRHLIDPMLDLYAKYKTTGPFCGMYRFWSPAVVVTELDLVKSVLVKDFQNFIDRGTFYNERDDPLSAHLFTLDGTKWRQLRSKLTSTFTSGKMKFMFKTVLEVGQRFADVFGKQIGENGAMIEIKDLNARFTTDVIGTCAFGIECNSLRDPNAKFREHGRKIFEKRYHRVIFVMIQTFPNLGRRLRLKTIRDDVQDFFMKVVRDTVTLREKESLKRNDFMDILIDLKNTKTEDGRDGITVEEIAAQAFVFFIGGFETSSSTMSHAMFEMARNPEIQEKVRAEVNDVLARHNGEITYESLGEMTYLGQVIEETLRMYPILALLQRRAQNDYETRLPNYKIEKGTIVFIPVQAFHHDPEIYPNPSKFDPERFTPEEKKKRDSCAYLPFGEGPRNCIGLRFGKMQTKIGLALMVKNFRLSVCDQTEIPLKFDPTQFIRQTVGGIYLKADRVKA